MKLVWKLLRRHISLPQLAGFFFANLLGMIIVLLSLQFYRDIKPVFSKDDGFINPDYIILSKRVYKDRGTASSFSKDELDDLKSQAFTKSVGTFTATQYEVACDMDIRGLAQVETDLFFEGVPDAYVDVNSKEWRFAEGDDMVPIVLPRAYLAIYNFGFAPSQHLPKITKELIGLVDMTIEMKGNGLREYIKGKVIGFSSRLNTILVPESFIQWSNARYAPDADASPSRVILEVSNPADDAIMKYLEDKGYEMEEDKLDAGRLTFFLRLVSLIVMLVGLLISALSFYILMLSIYLLVEKNTEKMRTLLLIGYSPAKVALPYQLLTIFMNAGVLVLAICGLCLLRSFYMKQLVAILPDIPDGSILPAVLLGIVLFVIVSIANARIIRSRINQIWNNKE